MVSHQVGIIADGSCLYLTDVDVDFNAKCTLINKKIASYLAGANSLETVVLMARAERYISDDISMDGGSEFNPIKAWHLVAVHPDEKSLSQAELLFNGYDRTQASVRGADGSSAT